MIPAGLRAAKFLVIDPPSSHSDPRPRRRPSARPLARGMPARPKSYHIREAANVRFECDAAHAVRQDRRREIDALRQLGRAEKTLVISEDRWIARLYGARAPDARRLFRALRTAARDALAACRRSFAGRRFSRSRLSRQYRALKTMDARMFEEARASHQLHFLDVPDELSGAHARPSASEARRQRRGIRSCHQLLRPAGPERRLQRDQIRRRRPQERAETSEGGQSLATTTSLLICPF